MIPLFGNPIMLRELRANARAKKAAIFVLLLGGALSALILLLWPRSGVFASRNIQEIFAIFLNSNLAMLCLLTPGFTATTITSEREAKSFILLSTSLLTPSQILWGKLTAALGMTLLLMLATMPFTAVCALSGGISFGLLGQAYLIILVAALTYGLFGLAVSSLCQRNFTALVLTYIGIAVLAGAVWLPSVLLSQVAAIRPFLLAIRALSPFEALYALNSPERYELAVSGVYSGSTLTFFLLGMAILAGLCLLTFCFFILRPPRGRAARNQQFYTDTRTAVKRKLMFPFYLIDPMKRKKPIGRLRNVIFVAELRSKVFGKPKFILRSLSACILLSMGILTLVAMQYATGISGDTVRLAAIVFQVAVVVLLAPPVCSGSITDEVNGNTFFMLKMTPLSMRTIVAGKMKAGLAYVCIFLISSLPVLGALAYLESASAYWRVGVWLGLLILCTVLFVSAGLCASTLAPTTAAATAFSYAFASFICLGTLSVLAVQDRLAPGLVALVLSFNPLAAAVQITSDTWFAELPLVFGRRLWQNNLIFLGSLTVFLTVLTAVRVRIILHRRG